MGVPFDQATRAAQRKRWRRLGERALLRYGIENARLVFVSDSDSCVFQVLASGQRYALRIDLDPADARLRAMAQAELAWLAALRHDTALAVPEPMVALDGTHVQEAAAEGVPGAHLVTLLRWLPGEIVGERATPAVLEQMGAAMAGLHDHAERFALPDGAQRPHTDWSRLAYWTDPQNDTSATLTVEQRRICAQAAERLVAEMEQIGTQRAYSLIHADLHPGNCVLDEGRLGVIDFSDCRFGSHCYDMAVPLTFLAERDDYDCLRAAFYRGYRCIRPLPDGAEAAVQTFTAARAFDNLAWIHFVWPSVTHFPWGPALIESSIRQFAHYLRQRPLSG